MNSIVKVVTVQAIILIIGLACIELALRYIKPIPPHGGIFHTLDAKSVRIRQDKFRLKTNLEVIHTSSEFSALIHTNEYGYRKLQKESLKPNVLFLGDSFTFGHGVSDDKTFSSIFCKKNDLTCMNLGISGTNTYEQIEILKYALETLKIRPRIVVHVMLAACWIDLSGNDLGGNFTTYRSIKKTSSRDVTPANSITVLFIRSAFAKEEVEPIKKTNKQPVSNDPIKMIQGWIGDYEITKRTMLILSSRLKRSLYECSDQEKIESAIAATKNALNQLEQLANNYNFNVKLFVIHPYQELDGSYRKTESELMDAVPKSFNYYKTGKEFSIEQYFKYDGHFNVYGHANMASIIDRNLSEMPPRF